VVYGVCACHGSVALVGDIEKYPCVTVTYCGVSEPAVIVIVAVRKDAVVLGLHVTVTVPLLLPEVALKVTHVWSFEAVQLIGVVTVISCPAAGAAVKFMVVGFMLSVGAACVTVTCFTL
jgi:hypothetical protein